MGLIIFLKVPGKDVLSFITSASDLQFFATISAALINIAISGFPTLSNGVGTAITIISEVDIKVGSFVGRYLSFRNSESTNLESSPGVINLPLLISVTLLSSMSYPMTVFPASAA